MSAAEHLQEAIDVGCTRDDHDHVADHRAEVLAEAAAVADEIAAAMKSADETWASRAGWACATVGVKLRRMATAGKDTGGATQVPASESTQPAPAQVWHVYEEDTPPPVRPRLYTTKPAAEQGTIDLYREMGNSCPDYSWKPGEDGAHELLAGAEPVGIYLALVPVRDTPPDLSGPNFFQPGHAYIRESHGRTVTFQVTHLSTAPDGSTMTAFGWHQVAGYDTWRDYSNDDFEDGWTEVPRG